MMATTAASHRAWNGGSFFSRSTGPKPCMPPRSCTPSIAVRPLARCRRVLPGQLRRRSVLALVLAVEPGLARPGALEIVAHVEAQPTEPLGLQLDAVAVLEAAQPTMVGAGGQDVAGLQGVDRRDPLD